MSEPEQDEAADEAPEGTEGEAGPRIKGRRSFSRARRELTEDELSHAAVQKMMLDELDRLDGENNELKRFVDKYYEADKEAAILSEKQSRSKASELIYGALMTVGAAAIGYAAPSDGTGSPDYIVLVFGLVLVAAGIASKVIEK